MGRLEARLAADWGAEPKPGALPCGDMLLSGVANSI
jgi:hypothetical protein